LETGNNSEVFAMSEGTSTTRGLRGRDLFLGGTWQFAIAAGGFTIALGSILLFAGSVDTDKVGTVGALLMYAAAAQVAGAALGFLFGIPRTHVVATENLGDDPKAKTEVRREPSISQATNAPNTNLEQISDWLTKILVGVGLTQAAGIADQFARVVDSMASGIDSGSAEPFLGSLMIFAGCLGFLLGWVLARVWLARLLWASDQNMPGGDRSAENRAADRPMSSSTGEPQVTVTAVRAAVSAPNQ
jgi:hypothetical protein